jgi:hypothetical protein
MRALICSRCSSRIVSPGWKLLTETLLPTGATQGGNRRTPIMLCHECRGQLNLWLAGYERVIEGRTDADE